MKKHFILMALLQLAFACADAQTKDIGGTVTNEKNEPVAGASVKVKGSTTGVFTDDNGVFSLQGIADSASVVISAAGYQETEVSVADKTSLSVTLIRAAGHDLVYFDRWYRVKYRLMPDYI